MHPPLPCQSLQARKQLFWSLLGVCALTIIFGSVYYWHVGALHISADVTSSLISSQSLDTNCSAAFNLSRSRTTTGGVPMILHFLYKDRNILEAYRASMESCIKMNSNWTLTLWTDSSVKSFLSREYPQYMPVFYGYPHKIQRADAIRYLILYRFGGVYLDLDMSCRQPLLASLSSIPCFLDREREHQSRVIHGRLHVAMNSAMGCRPCHPFFRKMMDFVFHTDRLKGAFSFPYTIFFTTGPFVLTQIYDQWHASSAQPAVKLLSETYFSPRINPRSGVNGICRNVLRTLDARSSSLTVGQKACLDLQALGFERSDAVFTTNLTVAVHEFTHLGYYDHSSPTFDALKLHPGIHLYPNISSIS